MPNPISILVVEDELLIAHDLKELLEEVGYQTIFLARTKEEAKHLLTSKIIDLVLLDINLNKDSFAGIEIATFINQHYQLPFIYITSYSDSATVERVKYTRPAGFLLKPFTKELLSAKLEITLYNYLNNPSKLKPTIEDKVSESNIIVNGHLLVKQNYRFEKVHLDDILWFESDKNYINIKTRDKKHMLRSSLKRLHEELPKQQFVKCYKTYIVNLKHAQAFNARFVNIAGYDIPISRYKQEEVFAKLKQ